MTPAAVAKMQGREDKRTRYTRRVIAENRRFLFLSQMGICGWCGKALEDFQNGDLVHIDHIKPVLYGGHSKSGAVRRSHYNTKKQFKIHRHNLRLVHASCNLERGDSERLSEVPF